ncbi:MAG: ribonuclease HII [bacterium]|nr:ribonuclease HII [bacterium]
MATKKKPTFLYERELMEQGFTQIVGVDEAGCGALAGPVVAGAVILPLNSRIGELNDSKQMSEKKREGLYELVTQRALAWAYGIATVEEIYEIGIRQANYLAMRRAVEGIEQADYALVDAWTIPELTIPQQGIIKGDTKVKSIAAASIISKVTRDRMLYQLEEQFPQYGFATHKGYGTKQHRDAIAQHGPCPIHRLGYKTFN